MGGKKGGFVSSIGNATGLSSFVGGSGKYLVSGGLSAVYENTIQPINQAKREGRQEIARQKAVQAENERMVADQESTVKRGQEMRQTRARQRLLTASRSGRASTILTSPLGGGAGAAPEGMKTLLGE